MVVVVSRSSINGVVSSAAKPPPKGGALGWRGHFSGIPEPPRLVNTGGHPGRQGVRLATARSAGMRGHGPQELAVQGVTEGAELGPILPSFFHAAQQSRRKLREEHTRLRIAAPEACTR
jgi:hypothetical protein